MQSHAAVLQRVKLSRMSVDWTVMERVRCSPATASPARAELKKLAVARFEPYMAVLSMSGVVRFSEGAPLNLDAYRKGLADMLK